MRCLDSRVLSVLSSSVVSKVQVIILDNLLCVKNIRTLNAVYVWKLIDMCVK